MPHQPTTAAMDGHANEGSHERPHHRADGPSAAAEDPVCGMTVDPATAGHKAVHDGQAYFFCPAGCETKLQNEPDR